MPSFLWTGKDAEGRQKNEFVPAKNAPESKAILIARGWTQLELMGDETLEAVHAIRPPIPEERRAGVDALLNNPDLRVARARGQGFSFLEKWWAFVLKAKFSFLILSLCL